MELEREYKRKSAFITCIYVSSRKSKNEKGRLQEWTNHLKKQGFKHIAYIYK